MCVDPRRVVISTTLFCHLSGGGGGGGGGFYLLTNGCEKVKMGKWEDSNQVKYQEKDFFPDFFTSGRINPLIVREAFHG